MTYRHITNMLMPGFAKLKRKGTAPKSAHQVDQAFLGKVGDYKIGAPAMTKYKTEAELRADGYVGIYTTLERLQDPAVKPLHGWPRPEKMLGQEFRD